MFLVERWSSGLVCTCALGVTLPIPHSHLCAEWHNFAWSSLYALVSERNLRLFRMKAALVTARRCVTATSGPLRSRSGSSPKPIGSSTVCRLQGGRSGFPLGHWSVSEQNVHPFNPVVHRLVAVVIEVGGRRPGCEAFGGGPLEALRSGLARAIARCGLGGCPRKMGIADRAASMLAACRTSERPP